MAVSQLGYLGIGISDLPRWEGYATTVLGLEITERGPDDTVYLRLDEYHHRISLHPDPSDDLLYVGWQCSNRSDYEATKVSLYDGGVEFVQATEDELANRHVVDMVKFTCSGVQQEVYYGPHLLFERPFHSQVLMTNFRTGDLGMGHVGLIAEDQAEMLRVMTECLGFKVSDNFRGQERFVHCNGREHTAVVMQGSPGSKRIQHFLLEVNSLDDVGMCLDRVEDNEIPIQSRLGRHTNDHMVSFYMVSPSAFGVEYGWNGRLIDDAT
jgi:2,3-dihydroxybiphenyl 1,2-dioxygenase